jgi:hypothetical protein
MVVNHIHSYMYIYIYIYLSDPCDWSPPGFGLFQSAGPIGLKFDPPKSERWRWRERYAKELLSGIILYNLGVSLNGGYPKMDSL